MRIVVTGGRDYFNPKLTAKVLSALKPANVAHGGAHGADLGANSWCLLNNVPVAVFPAAWNIDGKAAGPIRNRQMLDTFKPDLVVAFKGGRGTEDCVSAAKQRNIPVLRVEDYQPKD